MTTTAPSAQHGTATSVGKNTIADGVVEKVAGIAAREVPGVHDLGNGAARALGAIRHAINAQDRGQGISVEVGEKQVAADVTVVAEYPVALQTLAGNIRSAVSEAISSVVGMEASEVNVTVSDVHIPADDADDTEDESESRVQ
ncbi:Asp23/Gls24 family envelope stress response protein [Rathayibacter iranicus]|uniref:Asp23/Gls24 family envelope stress response protein n=2 Tax=Rathayibacter iranicus TaxID=59737 RepID=A0AAD1AG09_9MICO|nr:Asp23/Gls24 family envelope stress response protein [Rathayibacter iranicus]AZZ56530.1 Asp23/Gls24 family envelope stress response protein [Rathayibacter iranicus]MWV31927.1 Asp23/Gls24 family envelope stress response protein [Rathayibacter iranicus NCPPB 2253 = VKM Ac-1602]PPI43673.1 Asp23/Gls24 family envelope stress response protein [Rathayibacter iranicus]PPI58792.1 Asp23/Gls24 family envelope stress response protein [Rathayibacter iranicus]PPI69777.1 Asp23/Gls24 family envelope stress 